MTHCPRLLVLLLGLGLAACESPDDQTYDPVTDGEEVGEAPPMPEGGGDAESFTTPVVRYACPSGKTMLVTLSPDREAAAVVLEEQDLEVRLVRTGDGEYRDTTGTAVARLTGDRVSFELDGESLYRDCEPQEEVGG